jgi:hypothetical protein
MPRPLAVGTTRYPSSTVRSSRWIDGASASPTNASSWDGERLARAVGAALLVALEPRVEPAVRHRVGDAGESQRVTVVDDRVRRPDVGALEAPQPDRHRHIVAYPVNPG